MAGLILGIIVAVVVGIVLYSYIRGRRPRNVGTRMGEPVDLTELHG